jgi:DNA-binding CsgD family transcriptional regulator
MNKSYVLFLWVLLPFMAMAQGQTAITLTDSNSIQSNELSVLADKSYTFEQIRDDTTLHFVSTETLRADSVAAYWIKVKVNNPFPYAEKYMVELLPMLDNTLYWFDEKQHKWISYTNGLLVNNRQRNIWLLPCVFQGKTTATIYLKCNVRPLRASKTLIQPAIWLEKDSYIQANEQFIALVTFATVFVFVLFLLYNAYIYFIFRDSTFLYYLIAQMGGLLFILADQFYFNVLLPFRFCVSEARPDGFIVFHDLNSLVGDFALALIVLGYVQITRIYLDTPRMMPVQDKTLRYLLAAYLLVNVLYNALLFAQILPIGHYYLYGTIFLLIAVVLSISYVAILSYRRRYRLARYFLVANAVSVSIILVSSFYYLFIDVVRTTDHALFAKVAVIAQAFCLALALVQRILLIREDLKAKQLEAQELTFQNTLQQAQNDLLQQKLDSNQRELASNTLYITQKNELLLGLKTNMQLLNHQLPNAAQAVVKNIESIIHNNLYLEGDWERFRIHFEQVHPDFFKNLQKAHPTLTKNEIRLYAYFHINLSTKEIATLLNIDPASVRKAKMRLNKKMNIEANYSEIA